MPWYALRRHRQHSSASNNISSKYNPPNSRDTIEGSGNRTMQSLVRDYQQPEGRFSNGTYIPHVPLQSQTDREAGNSPRDVSISNSDSISSRRVSSISTSLSGMGLPYQIPRPSVSQSSSINPYVNSTPTSGIPHYYNDPYGT